MPQRTYFDPNFDYSKAMNEAMQEGDITNLGALARQRELKIASDPTKYGNVKSTADILGDYSYLLDGTNPSMEDYGLAVNKARGVDTEIVSQAGPYIDPLAQFKEYQDALTEAKACKDARFDHLDLVKDDTDENEKIL